MMGNLLKGRKKRQRDTMESELRFEGRLSIMAKDKSPPSRLLP